MFQVPWPIIATSRFVDPNGRCSMVFYALRRVVIGAVLTRKAGEGDRA
jgi:hypothetical protein